jgi:hypothetical protein
MRVCISLLCGLDGCFLCSLAALRLRSVNANYYELISIFSASRIG